MRRLLPSLPLTLILLLALSWRLLLWAQPLHEPANDEVEYLRVAQDLLARRGWTFYEQHPWLRAPLYPLFLAGSLWLAGGDLHRAALPNLLLGVGVVYLVYHLTRILAPEPGEQAALLAAGAAALLQTYATFASLYMSETLFSALFAGALLALAQVARRQAQRTSTSLGWLALAGALLGLACLTRSAALVFVPLATAWAAWQVWRAGSTGAERLRGLVACCALPVICCLVIAPWTIRNCRAYGRCVLIETGFAYNLWAFYEPREELEAINRALAAIENPAQRADEATRRGLERLREDPAILLRKPPAEWTRLWGIKPIQDRFLLASYYSDPPPVVFLAGLLLDDLLYLLILVASAWGLAHALARRNSVAWLLALWLLAFVGTTMLTHAEWRYRHFIFMALLPLAGLAADGLLRRRALASNTLVPVHAQRLFATLAVVTLVAALLPLFGTYPWVWAGTGALRSLAREAGNTLAAVGQHQGALWAYEQALAASPTPDGWIALGDERRAAGDVAGALAAYNEAHALAQPYVVASARQGDLLRELGRDEAARTAFRGRYLDEQRLLDWSFERMQPVPSTGMEIGDGLDFGYLGGFYPAETQQGAMARWSSGRAWLRLSVPAGANAPTLLRLRAAAPRPNAASVELSVCSQNDCQPVTLGSEWRIVQLALPSGSSPIELRSATFSAPDGRELGVLLDWARLDVAAVEN